jgi:hypothetical protein
VAADITALKAGELAQARLPKRPSRTTGRVQTSFGGGVAGVAGAFEGSASLGGAANDVPFAAASEAFPTWYIICVPSFRTGEPQKGPRLAVV